MYYPSYDARIRISFNAFYLYFYFIAPILTLDRIEFYFFEGVLFSVFFSFNSEYLTEGPLS